MRQQQSGRELLTFRPSSTSGLDGPACFPQLTDDELFETPFDLVCPITHELFMDPVSSLQDVNYEGRKRRCKALTAPPPACTSPRFVDSRLCTRVSVS